MVSKNGKTNFDPLNLPDNLMFGHIEMDANASFQSQYRTKTAKNASHRENFGLLVDCDMYSFEEYRTS